jgi:transposase
LGTPQAPTHKDARFSLVSERLGPLPLINHFIERLGLPALLEQHLPAADRRCVISHAQALGVLLRSIIVEREPIYRQQETTSGFAQGLFGLSLEQMEHLSDDRIGRALDHLFEADRAVLLTEVVLTLGRRFGVTFSQLHNDSTSVSFCGQYGARSPRSASGRTSAAICFGHSKEHRPDLKQLLFILTIDAEGGVPVGFRCADGNTNDSTTHIQTWESLRKVAGRADFLYVADSKLCSSQNTEHIHRAGGRFVTVLPRSRIEDQQFRKWMQTNSAPWELVWDRENRRHRHGPRDQWSVYKSPLPSMEAWPVIWVFSNLLKLHQGASRVRRVSAATEQLEQIRRALAGGRSRRGAAEIDKQVLLILEHYHVGRYLKVRRVTREVHTYKQATRGRPGPHTAYRKITKQRYDLEYSIDEAAVVYDQTTDGTYPLLTNDRSLTPAQVLEAHKGQPAIEKRFEQLKTVHAIAPVYLKKPGRIEALFTVYFLVLLVQALIERELRLAMKRDKLQELPLYPEQRCCHRPTTEQVLRLFGHTERHTLFSEGHRVKVFEPTLTELQQQVLSLLGVPSRSYGQTQ